MAKSYPWLEDRGYTPTADELRAFMDRHELTQDEVCEGGYISRATLNRYLSDGTDGKDAFRVRTLVRYMRRLDKRL